MPKTHSTDGRPVPTNHSDVLSGSFAGVLAWLGDDAAIEPDQLAKGEQVLLYMRTNHLPRPRDMYPQETR